MKSNNDRDIYLVLEYMKKNLYELMREDILEDIQKKIISYQIVKALKYLHTGGLIYYDLKPINILLNSKFNVKIYDFGSVKPAVYQEEA